MKYLWLLLLLYINIIAGTESNSDLTVSKHTDQSTVVSLTPAPATEGVYPDADIEAVFSIQLDEKQVKPNSERLRQIDGKKLEVAGDINYDVATKTLRFTPQAFLEPGLYEVDIKDIKAAKESQLEQIKNITYRFSVADVHPTSLKIVSQPVEVQEGMSTGLGVAVVYADGSERSVQNDVSWISADTTVLGIETNANATGIKEGETKVVAEYKGLTVETNALVYLEINGHRLPFEPDPTLNNATLLGIDANSNGVRDDVERWIYMTYKDKHPIHIDIAMQAARAFKKVLETPEKAKEIRQVVSSPIYCEGYFSVYANQFGDKILINARVVDKRFENMYFNTSERNSKYLIYQNKLSGDSYTVPWPSKGKNYCDFNMSKYEN